jgi:gas vesicle structural protein
MNSGGPEHRSSGSFGYLDRPASTSLADVIDVILNKGLVIDAYVRVSLVGIEILTIDARIIVASVDTYLRFAEATNRLDLSAEGGKGLTEFVTDSMGTVAEKVVHHKVSGVIDTADEKVADVVEVVSESAEVVSDTVGDVVETVSDKVGDVFSGGRDGADASS